MGAQANTSFGEDQLARTNAAFERQFRQSLVDRGLNWELMPLLKTSLEHEENGNYVLTVDASMLLAVFAIPDRMLMDVDKYLTTEPEIRRYAGVTSGQMEEIVQRVKFDDIRGLKQWLGGAMKGDYATTKLVEQKALVLGALGKMAEELGMPAEEASMSISIGFKSHEMPVLREKFLAAFPAKVSMAIV